MNVNYNKMSDPKADPKIQQRSEEMKESLKNEKVEPEIKDSTPIIGIVYNCVKLNVREEANKMAKILKVIDQGTKVTIGADKYVDYDVTNWVDIILEDGTKGYVMGQYIKEV